MNDAVINKVHHKLRLNEINVSIYGRARTQVFAQMHKLININDVDYYGDNPMLAMVMELVSAREKRKRREKKTHTHTDCKVFEQKHRTKNDDIISRCYEYK